MTTFAILKPVPPPPRHEQISHVRLRARRLPAATPSPPVEIFDWALVDDPLLVDQ